MALVAPLRGIRFNPEKITRLEEVVTPPYDVISEEAGAGFLEKNPWNMIQLDLRNTSGRSEAATDRYTAARDLFTAWQQDEVLVRDEEPAIYLYAIEYTHPSGRRLIRRGLVALVGLHEFSEGIVKPHEQTFAGVIGDRLRLMETCNAQFSQIFSIYSDPDNSIMATLDAARDEEAVATVLDLDGNRHSLWRVRDPRAIASVTAGFSGKAVYIADGHHRYTTALALQKKIREANPGLPAASACNFVMMYLCPMEDPGLSVLPTHRLVRWPGAMTAEAAAARLSAGCTVEAVRGGSREELLAVLLSRMDDLKDGPPVLGLYHAGEDRAFLLRGDGQSRTNFPKYAGLPPELQELDVVVLSEVVLHDLLGLDHDRCVAEGLVRYISDPDDALDVAVKLSVTGDEGTPLLFLLNPTRVEQVRKVADRGLIMPHKSTFFYPKILTGLLLHKLDLPVTLSH